MATITIALGGNALQRDGEATAEAQQRVARETASNLVPLLKEGHTFVIVHGNGPQVGNIVLHEEAINTESTPSMPLDTCVAMSQGSIGYWLQLEITNVLAAAGIERNVVTLVTQTVVDESDAAFSNPSKPIGQFYASQEEAEAEAVANGFVVKEDSGRGWRRVVPSPNPVEVLERASVTHLVSENTLVIAGGGGGVPVVRRGDMLQGVEAVIDKDKTASLLAMETNSEMFVILTAVPAVMINFGTDTQESLATVDVARMKSYIAEGHFAAGSMLPKVEAAVQFAENANKVAVIGDLADISEIIDGKKGTRIVA